MQGTSTSLALALLCCTLAVRAKLGPPGGPRKLHYYVPDSFQVMSDYRGAVAIMDSDNDTVFDCLVAKRTEIDHKARKATYVWKFKGGPPKKEVSFITMPGSTPGTLDLLVDDDPSVKEAILYYTDHNCSVMDFEYNGHRCVLWVRWRLRNAVPQICVDRFTDTCGVVVD